MVDTDCSEAFCIHCKALQSNFLAIELNMTSETLLHNTQLTVVVEANGLEVIHVWRVYDYQNNNHTA